MQNYIQKGEVITVPAPSDIASGDALAIGLLFGVASDDAITGENVDIATVGVFELPKVPTDAFAIGDPVFFAADERLVTAIETDRGPVGVAVSAAGNPSGRLAVKIG